VPHPTLSRRRASHLESYDLDCPGCTRRRERRAQHRRRRTSRISPDARLSHPELALSSCPCNAPPMRLAATIAMCDERSPVGHTDSAEPKSGGASASMRFPSRSPSPDRPAAALAVHMHHQRRSGDPSRQARPACRAKRERRSVWGQRRVPASKGERLAGLDAGTPVRSTPPRERRAMHGTGYRSPRDQAASVWVDKLSAVSLD
jgi:hypothetical protein